MVDTNFIFPDLNEGITKKTIVIPPISNDILPLKTFSQFCYVSGMQAYNQSKNIGFPNLRLSGFIICYELPKIPHPILNVEPLTITLYIYFDCSTAQVRCYTICYNKSNKIDMYNFTNYLYKNRILTTPPGLHLPGVPKTNAILLVPSNYFRNDIKNHFYLPKKTSFLLNPYFKRNKRTPKALKSLMDYFYCEQNDLIKGGLPLLPNKLREVLDKYNFYLHRRLYRIGKKPNFGGEEVKIFYDHLNWESFKCTIIK